jgi:hypothetical protein
MIRKTCILGSVLLALVLAGCAVWAADSEKPLDNAEIVKLTKLDMGDAVIIAKIKSAGAVQFATGTDDLVKLKESGVSKAVIAAMLDRSSAGTPPPAPAHTGGGTSSGATVTLQAKDGPVALQMIEGDVKTIVAPFVGMRRFIIFSEVAATVRTKDRKPSVTIATDRDPRKSYWMVRLDQDTDKEDMNRSIDVESPGMWGGTMSSAPDGDSMVKCDETEEKPGVWRFTPVKDLKPGEYGIYVGKGEQSATLYDFGVDK